MIKYSKTIIAVLATLLCSSCAKVTHSEKDCVSFTAPEGAELEAVEDEPVDEREEAALIDDEKLMVIDKEKWAWPTLLYGNANKKIFSTMQMDGLSYIVCNDDILYANPVMMIDSIAPNTYRISTLKGDVDIDFAQKGWRGKLAKLPQKLDSVKVFEHKYIRNANEAVMRPEHDYFIHMELPDSGRYSEKLNKWLVDRLCYEEGMFEGKDEETGAQKHTHYYSGNPHDYQAIGKHLANQFFRSAPKSSYTLNIYLTQDYRIFYETPKYLTYQKYCYDFSGGAHGYNVERLISYDTDLDQEIDNKLLFKPGTTQAIRNLIFESAQQDSYFKKVYGERTIDEVKKIFASNDITETFEIPQPGVTPQGLLFSFQPYQLGGFAQGCFHILVPYSKTKPYITDTAKSYF